MLGAIAGDIIGSVYEGRKWQGSWQELPLFTARSRITDDTVMTLAVAESIMDEDLLNKDFTEALIDNLHDFGHRYPRAGYGGKFSAWLRNGWRKPYNSFGNGSAMRVSPVGWAFDTLEEVEDKAGMSAAVTHNHPEGIKGAQAVAGSVFLARTGHGKDEIRDYVARRYGYNMDRTTDDIRKNYKFDVTCQGSVPEAICAFLDSSDFEEAVRRAVWLGGDADTQAAIAGSIAEAFYKGVPAYIAQACGTRLDETLYDAYRRWQNWLAGRRS